jgi:hypothetical protein
MGADHVFSEQALALEAGERFVFDLSFVQIINERKSGKSGTDHD